MICLIIPPSPFLLDERVFMSLGVLKVASALERAGVAVDLLDLSGVRDFEEAVAIYMRGSPASCFGITATSPQLPAAVKIAAAIRSFETVLPRREYRIILGGPHATLVNAACKRETALGKNGRARRAMAELWKHFNVLVAGDGELAIFEAMKGDPPRLIDADDRHFPLWMDDKKLEASAYPARHLVDLASYKYQIDGVPALSLVAQLGCPFGCGFCAGRHSPMLRHIRTRSAGSIVDEMCDMAERHGTRGFMFYDDELNVSPNMLELMVLIKAAQYGREEEWRLRGFIKAELFTDHQAAAMYDAGFRWILVGFESGSERILDNINKKATREDNSRCVEIAHRRGLKVKALMSLGHPGESLRTVLETEDWLIEAKPDDFDVTIITPYPGSPYYDEAEPVEDSPGIFAYRCKNGDTLYQREVDYTREADYYKGIPAGGYVSNVWTEGLRAHELVLMRDSAEQKVRRKLEIPYPSAAAALSYEHSMGQTMLPAYILKPAGQHEQSRPDERHVGHPAAGGAV